MSFDIKTVYALTVMFSWLMVLALGIAYSGRLRDGLGKWILALIFISLGDMLILGRGLISDYLSILLANIFLAICGSLAYSAVCDFIPRRKNSWILFGPPFLLAIGFSFLMSSPVSIRVLFSGIILGFQNGVVVYLILRDPILQKYRIHWLLFIGFLSATLMYLGRTLAAVFTPANFPTFFAYNMMQFYSLSLGFFSLIMISFGFILLIRERTDHRIQETARALQQSEERFRQLSEATLEGVTIHRKGKILNANQALAKMFGYSLPEIIGKEAIELAAPEFRDLVAQNIFSDTEEPFQAMGFRKDRSIFWGELISRPIPYPGQEARVTVIRDITEQKRIEEELKALSLIDDLTGLYNRRGFLTLAEQELKTAQRMGVEMLLIFGDLDNMKMINDSFGHQEGDQALISAARILKEAFRESDIVARIGGDEFVILAITNHETSIEKMLNRLREFMGSHPLQKEHSYAISMSLGVAAFDPQDPSPIDVLISRADRKMYQNKQNKASLEKIELLPSPPLFSSSFKEKP